MVTKEERDADKAICDAATAANWVGFPTGILAGSNWVVSNAPDANGHIASAANMKAAAHCRNRLPLYIADAEETERRIQALEEAAKDHAAGLLRPPFCSGLPEEVLHALDVAQACALRAAIKILRGEE